MWTRRIGVGVACCVISACWACTSGAGNGADANDVTGDELAVDQASADPDGTADASDASDAADVPETGSDATDVPETAPDTCDGVDTDCGGQADEDTPASCDDGLACTDDSRDGVGCSNVVQAGYCVIDGVCVESGTLDPGGTCRACLPDMSTVDWSSLPDQSACSDGLGCTVGDHCVSGECQVTPVDCNDDSACTNDSCTEPAGECAHVAKCDDQNACTQDYCGTLGLCQWAPLTDACSGTVVTLDDFEGTGGELSNLAGWAVSGRADYDCPYTTPGPGAAMGTGYEGANSLVMCDRTTANWEGWEYRDFTIATARTRLSYWRDASMSVVWPSAAWVELLDQSGNLLQTLETFPTGTELAWGKSSFDLGAITAMTDLRIQVRMQNGNDGNSEYQNRVRLDLVQLTSY